MGRGIDTEYLKQAWSVHRKRRSKLFTDEGTRKWSSVRGPMDALTLSLDRIGWVSNTFEEWTDDLGISRNILDISPKLWDELLKDAVQRLHERKLAHTVSAGTGVCMSRVCADVVARCLASNKLTDPQKDKLAAATCNGVWTLRKAEAAGYNVNNTKCQLCGMHDDTIHARVWHCTDPHVAFAREKWASKKDIQKAREAGEDSLLWSKGLFPYPADECPRPLEHPVYKIRNRGVPINCFDDASFIDWTGRATLMTSRNSEELPSQWPPLMKTSRRRASTSAQSLRRCPRRRKLPSSVQRHLVAVFCTDQRC